MFELFLGLSMFRDHSQWRSEPRPRSLDHINVAESLAAALTVAFAVFRAFLQTLCGSIYLSAVLFLTSMRLTAEASALQRMAIRLAPRWLACERWWKCATQMRHVAYQSSQAIPDSVLASNRQDARRIPSRKASASGLFLSPSLEFCLSAATAPDDPVG